jgi:uncharacterized iron-regulated membrane protein
MKSSAALGHWIWFHKWSSLGCAIILLLTCVTGLPLIFYEEIEHLTGRHPQAEELPAETPPAALDPLVAGALALRPGEVVQYVSFDEEQPLVYVTTGVTPDAPDEASFTRTFDSRSMREAWAPPFDEGLMWTFYKLHSDLFAGLPGQLFIGLMGALFVVSLVTGAVLYVPFMHRLAFGTIRIEGSRRLRWLDLHNLLGIVTLAWCAIVGLTGVINSLAEPLTRAWRDGQLAEMVAPYEGKSALRQLGSVQAALDTALAAAPGMTPSFIAYPGTPYSSDHHFAVFLVGDSPLTARLYKPALIDAETGALTDLRAMPWYMQGLFLSQPLHFGDYGGMALKIVWALLDLVSILVLGSGIYLWLAKRRRAVS